MVTAPESVLSGGDIDCSIREVYPHLLSLTRYRSELWWCATFLLFDSHDLILTV